MAHSQGTSEPRIRGVGCEQTNTRITAFVPVHCNATHSMKQWLQEAEL